MSMIQLYLWKEWRDHRAGVFCLMVVLPLLGVLATCAWDAPTLATALSPGIAAAVGAKIALLHVGADLIPGELRRSRVRFLERLPSGLGRAYWAKLVFFASLTLFAALYAVVIAVALHALVTGKVPEQFLDATSEKYVLPAITCALWVFAVSAWVPHGALALPAALIVIAILCSPAWFFFSPPSPLQPTIGELRAFCVLSAVGAGVTAWFSFVRGYRFGANPARAACIGAVTAVLCLSPAWAWCGWRWHAAHTLDPHGARFYISHASLSESGSIVWLEATNNSRNGVRDGQHYQGVRLDVRTGEWKIVGNGMWRGEYVDPTGFPLPRVRNMILPSLDGSGPLAIDETGRSAPASLLATPDPTLPTPAELGLGEESRVLGWNGLGYVCFATRAGRELRFYDPFRGLMFDPARLYPGNVERPRSVIRPGRWLIVRKRDPMPELFDPETLESAPVIGWTPNDRLGPVLADGRFVVADPIGFCLYSPESGARERLTLRGERPGPVDFIHCVSPFQAPLDTFQLRIVALHGRFGTALARLDEGEISVTASKSGLLQPFGCESREVVLAIEEKRRIVKLRFGTGEREVVFPRED
jgi:hypothetical protein